MQPRLTQAGHEAGQIAKAGRRDLRTDHLAPLPFQRAIEHQIVGIAEILNQQGPGVAMPALGRGVDAERARDPIEQRRRVIAIGEDGLAERDEKAKFKRRSRIGVDAPKGRQVENSRIRLSHQGDIAVEDVLIGYLPLGFLFQFVIERKQADEAEFLAQYFLSRADFDGIRQKDFRPREIKLLFRHPRFAPSLYLMDFARTKLSAKTRRGSHAGAEIMSVQPANTRLIDHFKRVFTIIVGLAITEGCKHLWPLDWSSIFEPNVWMFLAFFITVIPIFHGADRALDQKYTEIGQNGYTVKNYLQEIYMLLFMALGFVLIAESIPQSTSPAAHTAQTAVAAVAGSSTAPFYFLFGATLAFDVLVLSYGLRFGSRQNKNASSRQPYPRWMLENGALSVAAFLIGGVLSFMPTKLLYDRYDLFALLMAVLLFIGTALRTNSDYKHAEAFLFGESEPQAATPQP